MAASMVHFDNFFNENINLSWFDHEPLLIKVMQEFYDEELLCDCTLTADGESFDCHRLVLSACSPFFHGLIQEHSGDRPVIIIDGITKNELKAIIEFIYTGETSIPNLILSQFFETCKFLQITGLMDYSLIQNERKPNFEMPISEEVDLPILDLLETKSETESLGEQFLPTTPEFLLPTDEALPPGLSDNLEIFSTSIIDEDEAIDVNSFQEQPPEVLKQPYPKHERSILKSTARCGNKSYQCGKCGNRYTHRRTLLHHLHWICDQPATHACKLCPYMGKRKYQLKSHMEHVHSRSLLKINSLRKKKS